MSLSKSKILPAHNMYPIRFVLPVIFDEFRFIGICGFFSSISNIIGVNDTLPKGLVAPSHVSEEVGSNPPAISVVS